MSWLSKYIKNVKSGWKGVKDNYQIAKARRNPVDVYADARSGKSFGYSSREEQEAAQPAIKRQNVAYRKAQEQKEKNDPWVGSLQQGARQSELDARKRNSEYYKKKYRDEARDDPSNYRYKYDDDGNVVGKKFVEPKTTRGQSREISDGYGLSGFGKDYSGMSYADAERAAAADNAFYLKQTSQNTSYTFNPETLAGANKFVTDAQFKIKESINDPFNSGGTVESKTKAIVDKTQMEIANMFDTSEEFDAAYNSDAKFADTINTLVEMGGDTAKIQSEIKNTPKLSDHIGGNVQSLTEYLNVGNSAAEQKAFNTLIPENKMAQDQIEKIANIPKQFRDLYFGTPESIGIYQERILQAKEAKRILNEEAKDAEDNLKRQAKLTAKRYRLDFEEQSAEIETNRLNAKNYMTGMLAKMGALNTTGKAPVALANLEEKYQAQATRLKQNYTMATTELDIKLDNELNDIENSLDREILKIDGTLLDDKETYMKEVLKLQVSSDKQIYSIQSKFGKEYRKQLEKYKKDAKTASNSYINGMYNTVSTYDAKGAADVLGMSFEEYRQNWKDSKNGGLGMDLSPAGETQVREEYDRMQEEAKEQKKYAGLGEFARDVVDGNANYPTGSSKAHQIARNQLRAAGYSKSDFDEDKKSSSDDDDWF